MRIMVLWGVHIGVLLFMETINLRLEFGLEGLGLRGLELLLSGVLSYYGFGLMAWHVGPQTFNPKS